MKFTSPQSNLLVLVPSNSPTRSQDNQNNNFFMKNIVTISAPSKYSSQLASLSYSMAIIHMLLFLQKMMQKLVQNGGVFQLLMIL